MVPMVLMLKEIQLLEAASSTRLMYFLLISHDAKTGSDTSKEFTCVYLLGDGGGGQNYSCALLLCNVLKGHSIPPIT